MPRQRWHIDCRRRAKSAAETNIYIETQLKAFRSGNRASEIILPIAEEISNEDLREIANLYAAAKIAIEQVDAD